MNITSFFKQQEKRMVVYAAAAGLVVALMISIGLFIFLDLEKEEYPVASDADLYSALYRGQLHQRSQHEISHRLPV